MSWQSSSRADSSTRSKHHCLLGGSSNRRRGAYIVVASTTSTKESGLFGHNLQSLKNKQVSMCVWWRLAASAGIHDSQAQLCSVRSEFRGQEPIIAEGITAMKSGKIHAVQVRKAMWGARFQQA